MRLQMLLKEDVTYPADLLNTSDLVIPLKKLNYSLKNNFE